MKKNVTIIIYILINFSKIGYAEQIHGSIFENQNGIQYGVPYSKIVLNDDEKVFFSDSLGRYIIELDSNDKYIVILKNDFVPKVICDPLNNNANDELNIELMPYSDYFAINTSTGPISSKKTKKFHGSIVNRLGKPISGALVHLINTPYYAVTNNVGSFIFDLKYDEIKLSPFKEFYIFVQEKEFENSLTMISKDDMLALFTTSEDYRIYLQEDKNVILLEDFRKELFSLKKNVIELNKNLGFYYDFLVQLKIINEGIAEKLKTIQTQDSMIVENYNITNEMMSTLEKHINSDDKNINKPVVQN